MDQRKAKKRAKRTDWNVDSIGTLKCNGRHILCDKARCLFFFFKKKNKKILKKQRIRQNKFLEIAQERAKKKDQGNERVFKTLYDVGALGGVPGEKGSFLWTGL